MKFEKLPGKLNLGEIQEKVLKFWKENKIFKNLLKKNRVAKRFFMMDHLFRQEFHMQEQFLFHSSKI